jgi:hypothetical protein
MHMSLRVPMAPAVAVTLIILPVIIVRAQAEGAAPTSPVTATVVETGLDAAAAEQASDESDEEIGTERQGNVLGAETSETASSSEAGETHFCDHRRRREYGRANRRNRIDDRARVRHS